jgi:8-oxo-dGTP diphosphatase
LAESKHLSGLERNDKRKHVVAALIVRDGKILVCQRTKDQPLPLKWEFPGGKIEPGEQPHEALARELDEELGIRAAIGRKVATVQHTYGNGGTVALQFFLVEKFDGEIENRIFLDVRWAEKRELPSFDFLEADIELVKRISGGEIL